MKRNRIIALFAGLSLAFASSPALAAPSPDTLLVAGYDSAQMAVIYGISGIDQEGDEVTLDCALTDNFVYELEKEPEEDATEVAVEKLKTKGVDDEEDGDVEFFYEDDEKRTSDFELYGTDDAEECGLTSVSIEPNGDGEVNHGTVVSTFAHLLEGGMGCIVRHFAQSDFGKSDPDAERSPETLTETDAYEVTLQSIKTSCEKQTGKDRVETGDGDTGQSGKANAPGQAKEKSNQGKGKANAPGQNK